MPHVLRLCLLIILAIGCEARHASLLPMTESRAFSLLEKSPTFKKYRDTAGKASCMINEINEREAFVVVGEDHPGHFATLYTFRIERNGNVYIFDSLTKDDDPWKLDYGSE